MVPKRLKRALILVAGVLFVIAGVAGLALPFLQGLLFLLIGMILLSLSSRTIRAWVEEHTRRYSRLHRMIVRTEEWLLKWIGPRDSFEA
jgi:uncharacterized membrane protein YbaN (DUF454 family)